MAGISSLSETLLSYLLGACDGFRFERLIKRLLAIRDGESFTALGGVHDGGADGFMTYAGESDSQPGHFIQISKQQTNISGKLRSTVARLAEVGRAVSVLTYWTSVDLPELDVLEEKLSKELKVTVRIKDRQAVYRLANHNERTREDVESEFKAEIYELTARTERLLDAPPDFVTDPSVYVFVEFETKERFGKGGLVPPIVDALIYWSLRDTDPDKDVLLSRQAVKDRIARLLPGAASNLLPFVDGRLESLSSKGGGGEERVRHHRRVDSFCLPYSMRMELAANSAAEQTVQRLFRQSLAERATEQGATDPILVAAVSERAIYKHFSEQGLILAAFLEKRLESIQISDQVVEAELQAVATKGNVTDAKAYAAALAVLRQVFYTPNELEKDFLGRLSRTSLLLFSLKHCPRLIEYFNQMAGNFRLLVGTDILVKAISESFLPEEYRHVTNVLRVARSFGAKLLLTEPVLHEIYTHLHAAHMEFRNHYAAREQYISPALASQSDRILIRTYFYAKLYLKKVSGWRAFLNRFLDADELDVNSSKAESQFRAYLCKTYSLDFVPNDAIQKGVNPAQLEALSEELVKRNAFKREELARNDALMALAVYAQRNSNGEVALYDGFGLRTWWLTKETHILQYTADLVRKHGSVPYIMRPEFLLNFLTLTPTASADESVRDLLPSHVGLQIGQHLPEAHMRRILQEIDNWKDLPRERVEIKISDAVDRLKFDRVKRYENNLDLQGREEADQLIAALRSAAQPQR
jgi:hypothetical protein